MPRVRPILQLRTRITLLVSLILGLALLLTGAMVHWRLERQTRESLGEKVALLSRIVAGMDVAREGLTGSRPQAQVQELAERIRLESGVDYVVVMDMNGLRLSHPNRSLIGARFAGGDDADVYRGRSYLSVAKGTLGVSVRAFTPVRNGDRQVGAVAVGLLQSGVDRAVVSVHKRIALGGAHRIRGGNRRRHVPGGQDQTDPAGHGTPGDRHRAPAAQRHAPLRA